MIRNIVCIILGAAIAYAASMFKSAEKASVTDQAIGWYWAGLFIITLATAMTLAVFSLAPLDH